MLQFIGEQLSLGKYKGWAVENDAPGITTLTRHAGGYDTALKEVMELHLQKINAGRKKRYSY